MKKSIKQQYIYNVIINYTVLYNYTACTCTYLNWKVVNENCMKPVKSDKRKVNAVKKQELSLKLNYIFCQQ